MDPFASSGRVFVLGAGASRFAGYPLASDLLSFIRNFGSLEVSTKEVASRIRDKLIEAEVQFTKHVVRNPDGIANLEELLTYLEIYHSFPGTNFQPWDSWDGDAIRRVITEKFLYYQHDLSKKTWGPGNPIEPVAADPDLVRGISDAWSRAVKPGDVIVTFNWDILHEVILWRSGLWSYRDGYNFHPGNQGETEQRSDLLMLKLHGSVNWVQGDEHFPVSEIASAADFFPGAKDWEWRQHHDQAQTDRGRKLILPTYLKDISSNRVLLELWTEAHQQIRRAKEMVVIGYSLNAADHPARLLFGTALRENTALKEITVVSPATTEWDGLLTTLNKKRIQVRRAFEDWLRAGS